MKSNILFSLLVFLALTLAACGPAATPTPTVPGPVTVTDALGRTLTFATPPSRIVVAGSATIMIADALYLFPEASERIAAISVRGQGGNFLPIVDPNAASKLTLDGNAGPEQIAAVHPDLVILKSYLAETLGSPIEALNIPVFYISLESPEQYFNEIKTLGQILGDESRAQQVVDFYQQHMLQVQQGVSGLTDDQKPSVLLMQHSVKGGETAYKVPPASWIQTVLVETAGGRPVWLDVQLGADDWTVITLEQVAAWNPDQIYIIDYFDDPAKTVEAFRLDPIAQNLKAVQSDHVFAFPKDTYSWDQPDTRWILGLAWLATHIQPGLFTDLDIQQEFILFYKTLYGLSEARINAELQPLLQGTLP